MRVVIVTESYSPDVNGVANSVARVADHLVTRGHQPVVIAPAPGERTRAVTDLAPYPVVRIPSVALPRYPGFRVALPSRRLADELRRLRPDVVHLASPFVLGARAGGLARELGLPAVAVYQTDVAAYASAYRVGLAADAVWRRLRRVHNAADRTLAPSVAAAATLREHGVRRVWLWRRGIDTARFDPGWRSDTLRAVLAPGGEVLVGYVGRLAPEKRVDLLAATARLHGVRLVVIGDGPSRDAVHRALPGAVFLGVRRGAQLARIVASLDIFVHTGPYETFGQTVQEALASGVPVVAPARGGPLDLVETGRTGTLVPPGDAAALAAAVAELAAAPGRRAEYGRRARASVSGRTWAAVGDELIGHYLAVLGAPAVSWPRPRPATAGAIGHLVGPEGA
jgi:phosphatidylinositol alpha 1,6-mannosyltransferase